MKPQCFEYKHTSHVKSIPLSSCKQFLSNIKLKKSTMHKKLLINFTFNIMHNTHLKLYIKKKSCTENFNWFITDWLLVFSFTSYQDSFTHIMSINANWWLEIQNYSLLSWPLSCSGSIIYCTIFDRWREELIVQTLCQRYSPTSRWLRGHHGSYNSISGQRRLQGLRLKPFV